jgi:hypothetical protein
MTTVSPRRPSRQGICQTSTQRFDRAARNAAIPAAGSSGHFARWIEQAGSPLDLTGWKPALRLALFARAVFEAGEFFPESQGRISSRAVALFRDDQLRFPFGLVFSSSVSA